MKSIRFIADSYPFAYLNYDKCDDDFKTKLVSVLNDWDIKQEVLRAVDICEKNKIANELDEISKEEFKTIISACLTGPNIYSYKVWSFEKAGYALPCGNYHVQDNLIALLHRIEELYMAFGEIKEEEINELIISYKAIIEDIRNAYMYTVYTTSELKEIIFDLSGSIHEVVSGFVNPYECRAEKYVCPFDFLDIEDALYATLHDPKNGIKEMLKVGYNYAQEKFEDPNFVKGQAHVEGMDPRIEKIYALCCTLYQVIRIKELERFIEYCEIAGNLIKCKKHGEQFVYVPELVSHVLSLKYISSTYPREELKAVSMEAAGLTAGYTLDTRSYPEKMAKMNNLGVNAKGGLDDSYKSKWIKLQKTYNDIFKVGFSKLRTKMNQGFFKKWYGRIPSLLQRYGNSAVIYENRMKGDPTQILQTKCLDCINIMANETDALFKNLLEIANRVSSVGTILDKTNALKAYCKTYKVDSNASDKEFKEAILKETTFRLAHIILQDHGIYGYTPEGIVENGKFPTANHIVISLFEDNPEEKPEQQRVNDIFQSPDSILIFAKPERLLKFENNYQVVSNKIIQNFNYKKTDETKKYMEQNYLRLQPYMSKKDAFKGGGLDRDSSKTDKTLAKSINTGILQSVDLVVEQKRRILQCIGAVHGILPRVSDLAKRAVAACYQEELKNRDNSFSAAKKNTMGLKSSVNKYAKQNQNNQNFVEGNQ